MSWEFQIKSCKKGGKIHLKMHLTEPKSCNILPQLQKNTKIASKVGGGVCKKVPMLQIFIIQKKQEKKQVSFKKNKSRWIK